MRIKTGFNVAGVDRALRSRPSRGSRESVCGHGLSLAVLPSGPGRWRYRYRPRGIDPATGRRFTQRVVTIGTTETHSLHEARREAAELRLRVSKGEDPAFADRAAAAGARAAAAEAALAAVLEAAARVSCRDLLPAFGAVLQTRGRSAKHQREELAQVRLGLNSVQVAKTSLLDAAPSDIAPAHIERIVASCPPGSRALRFGAIDRFLRWALRHQHIDKTAATVVFGRHERPKFPARRQRVLSAPELAAVWEAAGTLVEPVLRDFVRFLISTPCRESEAAGMRWRDVDLASRSWTMPTSKNTLPHRFPLNDRALALVLARRDAVGISRATGDALVFPAPISGKAFNSWSTLKRSLDRRLAGGAAEAESWRFHDLRRSCATALGDRGFDDALIDLLLNHRAARSRGGIAGVYNTAQRWSDRVAALAAWSVALDGALGREALSAEPTASVIAFPVKVATAAA